MGSLVLQIQQAGRLFDRMLDPVVAELGITLVDLPVLVTAVKRRGATLPQLRDWFGYPASTISLAARRLELQEYVRLGRDAADGRVLVVHATKPGRVAAEVALARIREIEDRIGRRADESAIDGCLQVLDAAREIELPRWMMEVALPRRRRPAQRRPQPSRRRSSARIADSSAGSA
jgi:DNA-binding MarR family transcriptional regulator